MNLRSVFRTSLAWLALPALPALLAIRSVSPPILSWMWSDGSVAWMLAPLFLCAAALLGSIFRQLRIALMALIVGAVLVGARWFPNGSPSGLALAYLTAILIPFAAALFVTIPEQSLFSEWGVARLSIALLFVGLLLMIPGMARIQNRFAGHPIPSLIPGLNAPIPTLVSLGALLAAALVVHRPESPNVGRFFFALSLHAIAIVNAGEIAHLASRPARELEQAFSLTCAILLAWLSIDCGWRTAFIDELTQLPGRRPMRHHFASLGRDFTIASLDIDHFKKINDTYGHDVGDQVLRSIASRLRAFRFGTAYRFGGEEFVIVMKRGAPEEHKVMLDELREQIAARPFILRGQDRPSKKPSQRGARPTRRNKDRISITVSIGLADSGGADTPDEALTTADRAMYTAKRNGRNRVCAA